MNKFEKKIYLLVIIVLVFSLVGIYYFYQNKQNTKLELINSKAHVSYVANILKETKSNTYFRKVLFTGTRSQLVVMDIPPGGEVGEEIHKYTEQTLFFMSGTGKAILDGKESLIGAGDVVVVAPGTKHNFVNTGTDSLKIYTVYAPPNHIDGRIHITKADSDADILDEAVEESNSLR
jgi:mannose-6-phosphate isomerase-like protein (cupin superfamily)